MKICMINGSPKTGQGASSAILQALGERLAGADITNYHSAKEQGPATAAQGCDAIVIAFPLYVDGIPSHLLRQLEDSLPEFAAAQSGTPVYVLINNGFYEGGQNMPAMNMMRSWARKAGLRWGKGLGIGGGGMTGMSPIGQGPMAKLGTELDTLAKDILAGAQAEDVYFSPNFPRRFYILGAHFGWRSQGKKNGLSRQDLKRRIT